MKTEALFYSVPPDHRSDDRESLRPHSRAMELRHRSIRPVGRDSAMEREFGATESLEFVRGFDFRSSESALDGAIKNE